MLRLLPDYVLIVYAYYVAKVESKHQFEVTVHIKSTKSNCNFGTIPFISIEMVLKYINVCGAVVVMIV